MDDASFEIVDGDVLCETDCQCVCVGIVHIATLGPALDKTTTDWQFSRHFW